MEKMILVMTINFFRSKQNYGKEKSSKEEESLVFSESPRYWRGLSFFHHKGRIIMKIKTMKINITTKNITLDTPLQTFIDQKIGGLERFIQKGPVSASVEIGKPSTRHKNGAIFRAEVNLKVDGALLRAEASHKDLRTAIDESRDELHLQIKKLKERKKDLVRKPSQKK